MTSSSIQFLAPGVFSLILVLPATLVHGRDSQHMEQGQGQGFAQMPCHTTTVTGGRRASLENSRSSSSSSSDSDSDSEFSDVDLYADLLDDPVPSSSAGCPSISAPKQKLYNVSYANHTIQGGNFKKTTFIGCDFRNARISHTSFKGAKFQDCLFDQKTKFDHVNFRDAKIWSKLQQDYVHLSAVGMKRMGASEKQMSKRHRLKKHIHGLHAMY